MDQNIFDVMIDNFQKFAKEIFSPGCENKFKVKLKEALYQIMKMGEMVPMVENIESNPAKKIKLDQTLSRVLDLPNEIWMKIIKYLPAKDVYGTLPLVNKRCRSLALDSAVLRIIKINPCWRNMNKKEMNILKHSTAPVKLINKNFLGSFPHIIEAISLTQNLKSLEFHNNYHWIKLKDGDMDYEEGVQFYMELVTALKDSKAKLEHLELKGFYVKSDVMIEITKIKTLKTFKISDARKVVITPEVLNSFAQNENQIENVEFDDIGPNGCYDPDFSISEKSNERKKAMNNFLYNKSNTLKSLKHLTWDGIEDSEVPLTNLKMCQNLEEFCGRLRPHDVEILIELPRLQKLKLTHLENPKYLLDYLNLDFLKYLSLAGPYHGEAKNIIYQELQMHNLPALQRLFLNNPPKVSEEFFLNLISNAPNLKSIQLKGSECPVSFQFMRNFFKKSNIFVCFNSKSFEEYLIENDLIVFRKYNRMKNAFVEWSSNNPEYAG